MRTIRSVPAAALGLALSVGAAALATTAIDGPPPTPSVASEAAPPAHTTEPDVAITWPRHGSRFDEARLRVRGEAEPGAAVTVNGRPADLMEDGTWSITLVLDPGPNRLTAQATDTAGNVGEAAITVSYQAPGSSPAPQPEPAPEPEPEPEPEPDPTKPPAQKPAPKPTKAPVSEPTKKPAPKPAPTTAFTAEQKMDRIEHDPPYSYYHGTGTPGGKVKVWSEYGHAYAKVDAKGHWETKVWFDSAPYGTHTWRVVAIHGDQERAFQFTGVRPEKPAQSQLVAHQKQATVEGDPPTNVYWGTATPGGEVKVWSEYGYAYAPVDAAGNWEVTVPFEHAPAGTSTFPVKALHGDQKVWFELTTVRPESEPAQVAFTANQKYGSSSAEVPAEKFWGTAQPGSVVHIESAYGEATVQADAKGDWWAQVLFPDAPRGEAFEVHVISKATGEVKAFSFTAT